MKLIKAIIKPFKLGDVKEALVEAGQARMTIYEVKGFGRQRGHTEIYRGTEYQVDFMPKVMLEIAVDDGAVDRTMKAIQRAALTGEVGDGKVFVLNVESALRIRTSETGVDAL